nr:xylulose kinase-1 [Tanacetum cinerariifolium]
HSADEIFQKELARLKGQEQRVTFDAESLGLGFANNAEELQTQTSAKTVPLGCILVFTGNVLVPPESELASCVPTGLVVDPCFPADCLKRIRRDPDGGPIILPPTTAEKHIAVQRELKARTTLLQYIPDDHIADFHYMDDAKDVWNAVKARFGGNAKSNKMKKSMLKPKEASTAGDAGEFALIISV